MLLLTSFVEIQQPWEKTISKNRNIRVFKKEVDTTRIRTENCRRSVVHAVSFQFWKPTTRTLLEQSLALGADLTEICYASHYTTVPWLTVGWGIVDNVASQGMPWTRRFRCFAGIQRAVDQMLWVFCLRCLCNENSKGNLLGISCAEPEQLGDRDKNP
jgi:hypothetical protein